MRNTTAGGLLIAAAAAVALLAGCGTTVTGTGSAASTPTSPSTSTSSSSAPTSTSSSPSADRTTASAPSSATGTETSGTSAGAGGSECTSADLDATLGQGEGAAGSSYYPLIFTNKGDRTCTLEGFPGVSYVTGDSGKQVGGSASWQGEKGPVVTLAPGDKATAQLQEVNVMNFPESVCQPVSTRGLRVYPPGDTKALFVPQADGTGCQADPLPDGQFQLSVQTIKAG